MERSNSWHVHDVGVTYLYIHVIAHVSIRVPISIKHPTKQYFLAKAHEIDETRGESVMFIQLSQWGRKLWPTSVISLRSLVPATRNRGPLVTTCRMGERVQGHLLLRRSLPSLTCLILSGRNGSFSGRCTLPQRRRAFALTLPTFVIKTHLTIRRARSPPDTGFLTRATTLSA